MISASRAALLRRGLLSVAGLCGLAGFLLEYGVSPSSTQRWWISLLSGLAVGLFLLEVVLAATTLRPWRQFWRQRWPALVLTGLLGGEIAVVHFGGGGWLAPFLKFFSIRPVTQAYVVVAQFYILGNMLIYLPSLHSRLALRRVRPGVAFLLLYLGMIVAGAGLLLLPRATPPGHPICFLDALFTSTSAVCVTGLIVRDTATELTRFGQVIVLLLIQAGGLGIMSLTATFSWLLGRGIGIRESNLLRDIFQVSNLGDVGRTLRFIVLFTFVTEALGACWLYAGLGPVLANPGDRLFCAVFHSVSAFCNAGFSTFTDSLQGTADRMLVVGPVAVLLILGGLGFTVVANLLAFGRGRLVSWRQGRRRPGRLSLQLGGRLSLQTRVVVVLSVALLAIGTVLLAAMEWDRTLAGLSVGQKLGRAFFQSATARTAGFNTLEIGSLCQPALFLLIVLMFIGAAPGSTAGGVKVTTLAITWGNLLAIGKGLKQTRLLNREISLEAVRRALVVFSGGIILATLGVFLLLLSERRDLMTTLFEVISAQGTVGLSMGLTSQLSQAGRVIVIIMMFLGRLGPLTFTYNLVPPARERGIRLPEARIMVG